MSVELIYRTSDPRALAFARAHVEKVEAVAAERREYERQALADFGPVGRRYSYSPEEIEGRPLVTTRLRAAGLACRIDEQPPAGPGWRLDSKTAWWLPKLATAEGKKRRDELAALSISQSKSEAIDVQPMHFGEDMMYRPRFALRDDIGMLYVVWGAFECRNAMTPADTDPVPWDEMPRSEWYAWREAVEAESAPEAKWFQ